VKSPERYLGANIGQWTLADGRQVWSMLAKSYIMIAIANVEHEFAT
jgi:hypothetical protein